MNENEMIAEISDTAAEENEVGTELQNENENEGEAADTDYEEILNSDMQQLRESFAELGEDFSVTDLKNPIRYGALRDMGLSPKEAYLATGGRRRAQDNRAHLTVSAPASATKRSLGIPKSELKIAREIFSDMSEAELHRLYKKVSE